MKNSHEIVREMLENDAFSRWLAIEVVEIAPGYCVLRMNIRSEMLNGFFIAHGGIVYSLCDSAFAFASNSKKEKSVSIETSISHVRPIFENDRLIATAQAKHHGKNVGVYHVEVVNQHNKLVALFKGITF